MQKAILLLFISFLLITCKAPQKQTPKMQFPDMHKIPDVPLSYIPDSLRYLVPILDSVFYSDMEYRYGFALKSKKEQAEMMKVINKNKEKIRESDSRNAEIVSGVLDRYGYLTHGQVGVKGNMALFSVIQHSNTALQKKYLPLFYKAAKEKKLFPSLYQMMADRIEMSEGRKQIYGTQIIYFGSKPVVYPILNPDSLDIIRKEMYMIPMAEYTEKFHLKWDVEEHKKLTADTNYIKKFASLIDTAALRIQ